MYWVRSLQYQNKKSKAGLGPENLMSALAQEISRHAVLLLPNRTATRSFKRPDENPRPACFPRKPRASALCQFFSDLKSIFHGAVFQAALPARNLMGTLVRKISRHMTHPTLAALIGTHGPRTLLPSYILIRSWQRQYDFITHDSIEIHYLLIPVLIQPRDLPG